MRFVELVVNRVYAVRLKADPRFTSSPIQPPRQRVLTEQEQGGASPR
jgi:hypothetical protein